MKRVASDKSRAEEDVVAPPVAPPKTQKLLPKEVGAPGAGEGPALGVVPGGIFPLPKAPAVVPGNSAVGVASRDDIIQYLLRVFAKSDFKHDFGEDVPSRDLITKADRVRFAELVQKLPVKERVTMLNKFDAEMKKYAKGTNLLELLRGTIAEQLYPGPPGQDDEFKKETGVLAMIGIDYDALKNRIKDHFDKNKNLGAFTIDNYNVRATNIFSRNYRIGAQKYKNSSAPGKWEGSTRNLASLFKDATGGKTKFALLVDASLGMSVTEAGNSTLKPDPGEPCTFAILQNVESDGDSATGATNFKITKSGPNDTTVRMLRDTTTSTVVYPIWNTPEPSSDTEHIFSKVQIILNRIESGEIEASILLGKESHNIPDVGTTSNVKNASLNGLLAWLAKKEGDAESIRKPYIYALLKRMGDWCQALSLLDRTRNYTQKTPAAAKTETLQDLITQGYEVGLVTNDRILLAYGLVLGLNVYFTTASDMNCLLYFKNKDDVASDDQLGGIIEKNFGAFKERVLKDVVVDDATIVDLANKAIEQYSKIAEFNATVEAKIRPFFPVSPGDPRLDALGKGLTQAFKTKVLLSNLGELRTNFGEIQTNMKAANDVYKSADATPRAKFDASVTLVNLADKYMMDVKHNTDVINRLKDGRFSGPYTLQKSIFTSNLTDKMKAGGRMATSEDMVRAKELLLSCRDDVKQIVQKKIMDSDLLRSYIPPVPGPPLTDKDITNFEALYGAFDAVRVEIPQAGMEGGQRGGDPLGVEKLLLSVKQREVFPYRSAKLETTVNKLNPAIPKDKANLDLLESLPAAQVGSYYRDDKSRPYSVIDRYIITKEDSTALIKLLNEDIADPATKNFVVYRFALLYHDILYERIEHVFDQSVMSRSLLADLEDPLLPESYGVTEGSLKEVEAVTQETAVLRVCINQYANGDQSGILDLLSSFQGGEIKMSDLMKTIADQIVYRTVDRKRKDKSLPNKIQGIRDTLALARGVIFGKYRKELPETVAFPDVPDVDVLGTRIDEILESEGAVDPLAPAAPVADVAMAAPAAPVADVAMAAPAAPPADEDLAAPAAPVADVAMAAPPRKLAAVGVGAEDEDEDVARVGAPVVVGMGPPRPPPAPRAPRDPAFDLDGGRLKKPNTIPSNDPNPPSGGSSRPKLYQGLRKRTGTGGAPGV